MYLDGVNLKFVYRYASPGKATNQPVRYECTSWVQIPSDTYYSFSKGLFIQIPITNSKNPPPIGSILLDDIPNAKTIPPITISAIRRFIIKKGISPNRLYRYLGWD